MITFPDEGAGRDKMLERDGWRLVATVAAIDNSSIRRSWDASPLVAILVTKCPAVRSHRCGDRQDFQRAS